MILILLDPPGAGKTWPLKRFYQERKLVAEVEGVGTPEGILEATKAALAGRI
jgi:hypothetical protein